MGFVYSLMGMDSAAKWIILRVHENENPRVTHLRANIDEKVEFNEFSGNENVCFSVKFI